MATITSNDESLVERDEVLYPNTDVIDTEPHYNNFTAIQNALRHQRDEQQQINITTHSSGDQYRAIRTEIEPSLNTFTTPINIQSKKVDGHIFNLIQIVENIGYNKNTPFIRPPFNSNTKNVSALLNIILKMGGAYGPLVNVWRSRIDNDYFQRWYLEKYHQRSASLIQQNTMSNINEQTTQNTQTRDYQSNRIIDNKQIDNERYYDNQIKRIYGYDDTDTISSISSHSSFNDIELKNNQPRSPSITSILKKNNNQTSQPKRHVTIREHYPINNEFKQSISSQQRYDINSNNNNKHILSDYQQFIQKHPDLNKDPNPEIITKPNPDHVTYKQNISVRYLVPPTPPPPGPLIIREIISPRAPSPPPLIVKYQQPSPPTPPPLILREAPPPPPPQQETTVLTKILPPEPQSSRRVVVEHSSPLPSKPQSIIIEKWLPYKPAPPREVIYERVTEQPAIAEFEPDAINIQRQRHHSADFQTEPSRVSIPVNVQQQRHDSAEFQTKSSYVSIPVNVQRQRRHSAEFQIEPSRVSIPVNAQRRNSPDYLEKEYTTEQPSGTFDELAWTTHQQILAMQQQTQEQVQAHQQISAMQQRDQEQAQAHQQISAMQQRDQEQMQAHQQISAMQQRDQEQAQAHQQISAMQQRDQEQMQAHQQISAMQQRDQEQAQAYQEILAMQQRGREQVQAHQQWAANQWQQHTNTFLQYPTQLTTPPRVLYHAPTTTSYVQRQEYRQQQIQYNPTLAYPFY